MDMSSVDQFDTDVSRGPICLPPCLPCQRSAWPSATTGGATQSWWWQTVPTQTSLDFACVPADRPKTHLRLTLCSAPCARALWPFNELNGAQVFKEFVGLILGFLTRPNQVRTH